MFAALAGCSLLEKNNLQKFSDGELATWRYMDESISSEEKDCSKVIDNANGLIFFQFVKDGKLISYSYWGKKTGHDKFRENKVTRPIFGRDNGSITYFKLKDKKITANALTLTAERNDGLISENYFSMLEDKSLQGNGWSYLNPTESQARQFENIKKFIEKKQKLNICQSSTLLGYFNKSEAINEKLPDSHLYLGARLIDLVPDQPSVSPLPQDLAEEFKECVFFRSDERNQTRAPECALRNPSPTYKLRTNETIDIDAETPRCCLSTVTVSSNQLTHSTLLDLFKDLPGVEKKEVECKKLSDQSSLTSFYEIWKDGSSKFSIREIVTGGSGGNSMYTTIYYGMPKINCDRISDIDEMNRRSR